jgi:hypothetical protein
MIRLRSRNHVSGLRVGGSNHVTYELGFAASSKA